MRQVNGKYHAMERTCTALTRRRIVKYRTGKERKKGNNGETRHKKRGRLLEATKPRRDAAVHRVCRCTSHDAAKIRHKLSWFYDHVSSKPPITAGCDIYHKQLGTTCMSSNMPCGSKLSWMLATSVAYATVNSFVCPMLYIPKLTHQITGSFHNSMTHSPTI